MINGEEKMAVMQMKRYMRSCDAVLSNCNYVPLRMNTTDEHLDTAWEMAQATFFMAKQLRHEGLTVLVDPMFKEHAWPRPDIWLPTLYTEDGAAGTAFEIWKSETMKVFIEKMRRYVRAGILIRVGYVTTKEVKELGADGAVRLCLERAKMPKAWIREYEGCVAAGQRS